MLLLDGWIYWPQEARRIEIRTGRTEPLPAARPHRCSPAVGGGKLVTLGGGSYAPREKNPGVMPATVVDLGEADGPSTLDHAFIDQRYQTDQAFRLRGRGRGNGDSVSKSSPMFHATRMFFRTVDYLWSSATRATRGTPAPPYRNPQE